MGSSIINLRLGKIHFMFLKKDINMKENGFQFWRFYVCKNKYYKKSWSFIGLNISLN